MKVKTIVLIGIVSITASGCTIGLKESPAWHQTASSSEKAAHFKELCLSYGYKAGSEELLKCAMEEQRESRRAAKAKMQESDSSISCTSTTYGKVTTTNCY